MYLVGFLCFTTIMQIISFECFFQNAGNNSIYGLSRLKVDSISKLRNKRVKKKNYTNMNAMKQKEQQNDIVNPNPNPNPNPIKTNSINSIRPLGDILQKAGVQMTDDIQKSLPPLEGIVGMYGSEPILIGEERCDAFQAAFPQDDRFLAPAGMFNTGTNLLQSLLVNNCHLPVSTKKYGMQHNGIKYQVPWGKHSPVDWRFKHTAPSFEGLPQSNFLPAVVIKDPYTWMESMCRHRYAAQWRSIEGHCPNLVPTTPQEKDMIHPKETFAVSIHYHTQNVTHHESLSELYNEWYGNWLDVEYPRLVIRFEDLMFHAEHVVEKVCKCAGGKLAEGPFQYTTGSAKTGISHKGSNGLVKSMLKYGDIQKRTHAYTPMDLDYAKSSLRSDVLDLFHYGTPP
jgi:cell fate (sporulation/competence/biofilm development) regulator YmcA (YheA/YmcA/DUF963 family)